MSNNQVNNNNFSMAIEAELFKIENNIRDQLNNGITPSLIKSIKNLTIRHPKILDKVGGLNTIVKIIKRNVEDDHSKIIKEFIIKSIKHNSLDISIRSALKECINRQYSEYHGWHPGPIRFYVPFRDNTPYINKDGQLITGTNSNLVRHSWNQIDASWLWNENCIYLWHRWVDKLKTQEIVYKELQSLQNIKLTNTSLYGDYPAVILCLVHGPLAPKMKMPKGMFMLNDPWALNDALYEAID